MSIRNWGYYYEPFSLRITLVRAAFSVSGIGFCQGCASSPILFVILKQSRAAAEVWRVFDMGFDVGTWGLHLCCLLVLLASSGQALVKCEATGIRVSLPKSATKLLLQNSGFLPLGLGGSHWPKWRSSSIFWSWCMDRLEDLSHTRILYWRGSWAWRQSSQFTSQFAFHLSPIIVSFG